MAPKKQRRQPAQAVLEENNDANDDRNNIEADFATKPKARGRPRGAKAVGAGDESPTKKLKGIPVKSKVEKPKQLKGGRKVAADAASIDGNDVDDGDQVEIIDEIESKPKARGRKRVAKEVGEESPTKKAAPSPVKSKVEEDEKPRARRKAPVVYNDMLEDDSDDQVKPKGRGSKRGAKPASPSKGKASPVKSKADKAKQAKRGAANDDVEEDASDVDSKPKARGRPRAAKANADDSPTKNAKASPVKSKATKATGRKMRGTDITANILSSSGLDDGDTGEESDEPPPKSPKVESKGPKAAKKKGARVSRAAVKSGGAAPRKQLGKAAANASK